MAKRKGKGTETAEPMVDAAGTVEVRVTEGMPASAAQGKVVIQVAPEDVLLDPRLQGLREWSGESVQEMAIPELARLMLEEGQEHPCKCRTTGDGDLLLYIGHRRREAIMYAREQGWKVYLPNDANGEPSGEPLLDVVVEEKDDAGALRAAMAENVQRADFTEIELMRAIKLIRETFHSKDDVWVGPAGTANVAGFLGVSPATVTQAEKLGRLPKPMQDDVQAGRMSPFAAREWLDTAGAVKDPGEKEKVQAAVLTEAQKIADAREEKAARKREEAEAKRAKTVEKRAGKGGKKGKDVFDELDEALDKANLVEFEQSAPKPPAKPVKGKLTGKDVRQAAAKVPGAAPVKTKAPRMSELTDIMEQWNSEAAYPRAMCRFADALSKWGHGKLPLLKLKAFWEDLADVIPSGMIVATGLKKSAAVKGVVSKTQAQRVVKARLREELGSVTQVRKKSVGKKVAKPAAGETPKGGKGKGAKKKVKVGR